MIKKSLSHTVEVPELKIDKRRDSILPRERIERRIVVAVIKHLEENGFYICQVSDGEEVHKVSDLKSAMEIIFDLDDCTVYFSSDRNKPRNLSSITFVFGNNGDDCIHDYNYANEKFNKVMESFDAELYV